MDSLRYILSVLLVLLALFIGNMRSPAAGARADLPAQTTQAPAAR